MKSRRTNTIVVFNYHSLEQKASLDKAGHAKKSMANLPESQIGNNETKNGGGGGGGGGKEVKYAASSFSLGARNRSMIRASEIGHDRKFVVDGP